jgi:hypothetical protein
MHGHGRKGGRPRSARRLPDSTSEHILVESACTPEDQRVAAGIPCRFGISADPSMQNQHRDGPNWMFLRLRTDEKLVGYTDSFNACIIARLIRESVAWLGPSTPSS